MITSFFKPKNRSGGNRSPENSAPNAVKRDRNSEEDTDANGQPKKQKPEDSLSHNEVVVSEADQLLSYLNSTDDDSSGKSAVSSSWRQSMDKYLSGPSFNRLAVFIAKER